MALIKEPYWILNGEKIKQFREDDMRFRLRYPEEKKVSLLKLFYIWIRVNIRHFNQLHFKKCDPTKKYGTGHYFDTNLYCLRCKKGKYQLDLELRLQRIRERWV